MATPRHPSDSVTDAPVYSFRRRALWFVSATVTLVVVTSVAFWPGLDGDFLNWDDDRNFVDNMSYRGVGFEQLRWAWQTYHLGVWQPLSWLLLGLQYEIGGMDAAVYHRASLVLHIINTVVFYVLAVVMARVASTQTRRVSLSGVHLCAAGVAMLFAVHPLRVEAVAWISCQPYLPAALLYMLAVLAYIWGYRPLPSAMGGHPYATRWGWLTVVFVCYMTAVTSKAVAVTFPVVLLILDVYPLRRWGGRNGWLSRAGFRVWMEKLPFLVLALLVSLWAAAAKDYSESRVPFSAYDVDARLAQSAYGVIFYLDKTIRPADLIPYYRLPEGLSLLAWRYGIPAITVLVVTVGLVFMRRRWPAVLAAWFAYVVILLPNLGVLQISQQIATDRYSYVAILPVMLLLAGGLYRLWLRFSSGRWVVRSALVVGIVAATTGLVSASRHQCLVWRDSVNLWQANLAVDPKCAVAECNLGAALLDMGDYVQASQHLSRAIDLQPDFAFAYSNLGTILYQAGHFEDAVMCYQQAITAAPGLGGLDLAKTHAGLGAAYEELGHYDQAWTHAITASDLGFEKAQKLIDRLHAVSGAPREITP